MEIEKIIVGGTAWIALAVFVVMLIRQATKKKPPSPITPEIAQRNLDIALDDAIEELKRADVALEMGDHAARQKYLNSAKNCISFAADMQEIIDNSTGSNNG